MESKPCLYIFSGLPAVGKTTVAKALARRTGACHLRIDTLEQSMVRLGVCAREELEGKGYLMACELAKDQLSNQISVIADCVNPLILTRNWWRETARGAGCRAIEVEFFCSDWVLHRRRAEERACDLAGMIQPDWGEIQRREYEPYKEEHLRIDTASTSVEEAVERILAYQEGR